MFFSLHSPFLSLLRRWFGKENGIYYINGPDTLPPPLSPEEEAALLAQNDNDAKSTLVEHNLRLVVYIAKKFENTRVGIEDLISIGSIGLIKAINTFRTDKNIKLATYASRCIENEILMFLRKTGNLRGEVSIDEPINIDWDGNELLLSDILSSDGDPIFGHLESEEDRRSIRRAIDSLDERDRTIVELRFGLRGKQELTQKEVADLLGISQSYISRLEKKIMAQLKDELASLV